MSRQTNVIIQNNELSTECVVEGAVNKHSEGLNIDNSVIDKEGELPLYQQLIESIRELIVQQYRIGDFLLPEMELAKHYQVNRHTIRRALDELVKQGIIVRKPGKGTVVVSSPIDYRISSGTRFTASLKKMGYQTSSKILSKSLVKATGEVAQKLQLEIDSEVIKIVTLRTVNDTRVCVINHYLPAKRFPKLLTHYRRGSTQEFLQANYDIQLLREDTCVAAMMPDYEQCEQLHMAQSCPLLCIKTVNSAISEPCQPVEYSISFTRSDCMQLQISTANAIQTTGTAL
ncbi:MAG: phosphonate metabolism transcriptional regulator PhnF [Arenicella sp.]